MFHVSLLELYHASINSRRIHDPLPLIEIDGEHEYEVEDILESKIYNRQLWYLIHWHGYDVRTQELKTITWMCKINVKMDFYYVNICKHEHEKNMTRLWCKIVPKIGVEEIERNEGSYFDLYPFGDLA